MKSRQVPANVVRQQRIFSQAEFVRNGPLVAVDRPMIVYRCDLCSQAKECLQKEIDGKEYDICSQCWSALAEKLSGKGRVNKSSEIVLLPQLRVNEREDDEPKPTPGEPPKI